MSKLLESRDPSRFESSVRKLLSNGLSARAIQAELGVSRHEVARIKAGRPRKHPAFVKVTKENILLLGTHIPETGCVEWARHRNPSGYGECSFESRRVRVHRLSWCFANGVNIRDLTPGQCILHSCDNPSCINPKHLSLGSQRENVAQMVERGRAHRHLGKRFNSRLTLEQVKEIRRLRADEGLLQSELAKMFSVGRSTISQILNRVTWSDVA